MQWKARRHRRSSRVNSMFLIFYVILVKCVIVILVKCILMIHAVILVKSVIVILTVIHVIVNFFLFL
uniref:Uncharacterized protein n=1 Tax=Setaria viridis TaxID=4556 RepID=A0A4U6WHH0_SETVI|nr:hypothetical protein SEVIR_1G301750v2 [Setaria viridis]